MFSTYTGMNLAWTFGDIAQPTFDNETYKVRVRVRFMNIL